MTALPHIELPRSTIYPRWNHLVSLSTELEPWLSDERPAEPTEAEAAALSRWVHYTTRTLREPYRTKVLSDPRLCDPPRPTMVLLKQPGGMWRYRNVQWTSQTWSADEYTLDGLLDHHSRHFAAPWREFCAEHPLPSDAPAGATP